MSETEADFFVLAHEPGHDQEALPPNGLKRCLFHLRVSL